MSLVPVKYPLDLTGAAATNLVIDEPHELAPGKIRVLIPKNGAFFSETLALHDASTNRLLVRGVDYYPGLLYVIPTEQTGKEVHQIIVIVDQTCGSTVLFNAQMLGGEYSYNFDGIVQMIQSLNLDNRQILFESIIGRPATYNPAPHLHDVGDTYGWEYMAAGLDRVRDAIMLGATPATKALFDYIDAQVLDLRLSLQSITQSSTTRASIVTALGYTPYDSQGGEIDGEATFRTGLTNCGFYIERIKRLTATSNLTTLELSPAGIFEVTLAASTALKFDVSKIRTMRADESLSFTLKLKNDVAASRAVAFPSTVDWADKVTPPRTTTPGGIDEFYFTTYDGGATWTGSLSNENVGRSAG